MLRGVPPVGANPIALFVLWGFGVLAMLSAGLSFAAFVPAGLMTPWRRVLGGYFAVWLGLNLVLTVRRRAAARLWWWTSIYITAGMWLAVLSVLWLFLPFGDTALQLGTIIFTVIYVATAQLATPDLRPFGRIVIVTTTLSMAAVSILHRVPLWPYLTPFLICFGLAMIMLDVTVKRSIAEMRKARLEAERDRDARTRFLAAASHDLGQPLQSARLFLDQATRSPDPARRARADANARTALNAMERLLNQMLDHLRLDAGAVQARPRVLPASQPIAHVAAQFQPAAQLAGVRLIAVSASAPVLADIDMLERALGNLVDNALRHAGARRILIGVRRRGAATRIYVIDDGVGVAADERDRLFDDYVQGRSAGAGERGGFGLGLASVRRMAELMGGRAGVDPGWCKGAAFFIELPQGDGLEAAA